MEHLQGVKNGLGALPARLLLGELLPALPVVVILPLLPLPVLPLLRPLLGPLALPGPGADLGLSPAALFGPAAAGLRPLCLPLGKKAFKVEVLHLLPGRRGRHLVRLEQLVEVKGLFLPVLGRAGVLLPILQELAKVKFLPGRLRLRGWLRGADGLRLSGPLPALPLAGHAAGRLVGGVEALKALRVVLRVGGFQLFRIGVANLRQV